MADASSCPGSDYCQIFPERAQKRHRQLFQQLLFALTGLTGLTALGLRRLHRNGFWIDSASAPPVFARTCSASRLFHKPRDGNRQGPVWDFDRAFADSNDGRGFNRNRWRSADGDGGTDPFNPPTLLITLSAILFTDPDFWQRWIDL
jgi:hypothetical protein